ncbi:MAG: polyphosphate polymerase domain-containing protein [Clostridia bacterium]|nr:polyphosphate polymerase domain-containing protein [Candidatus Pelethousia sp.]NCB30625.1 polyphosphate polymerase domain-containing protein [Clostridia bacterium]
MRKQKQPPYRHELKYFISQGEYTLLSNRLRLTMEQDPHARKNGGEYFIRSLYFDDPLDSAFREKMRGNDNRDKVRLRIYNMAQDGGKLECKHKKESYIYKQSLSLSRLECDMLLAGNFRFLLERPEPFAHEMFRAFATAYLKPVVLVDYDREPYVYPFQNVRVTFDKNLRTGLRDTRIFSDGVVTYPALEGYDMVMEVKFNEHLPAYIHELIQCNAHARSAISKYCLCRKFEV